MANKNFGQLPTECAARNPVDGSTVLITRGEMGYHLLPGVDVDKYNAYRNVTKEQEQAMLAGSMFGWDCPAADPQTYEK